MEREEIVECSPGMGDDVLDESEVRGIFGLRRRGWHLKAIARELGIARNTVRTWVRRGEGAARPGTGRPRVLEKDEEWVRGRYLAGVRNGDVLRQELAERGIEVSLRTIERCIKPIREEVVALDRASVRFETAPGQQMQIDFGEKWVDIGGERAKAFVFVATLGYSRRSFVQVFAGLRQRHWLAGLDAALRHFGGIPQTCLADNAKALVVRWQGDRPIFHAEFEAFCRHWGITPRACRPYRARTKGKVERSVGYSKSNALGRLSFVSWEALEAHLVWWMREVADVRLHGTTHERPIDRFPREAVKGGGKVYRQGGRKVDHFGGLVSQAGGGRATPDRRLPGSCRGVRRPAPVAREAWVSASVSCCRPAGSCRRSSPGCGRDG